jgi:hypothetical protein
LIILLITRVIRWTSCSCLLELYLALLLRYALEIY